jgi:hypothetical protein
MRMKYYLFLHKLIYHTCICHLAVSLWRQGENLMLTVYENLLLILLFCWDICVLLKNTSYPIFSRLQMLL